MSTADKTKSSSLRISFFTIGIFVISFALVSGILLFEKDRGMDEGHFQVGEPAQRTLFSPLEISYVNTVATQALQEAKQREVLLVFAFDPSVKTNSLKLIDDTFAAIAALKLNQTDGIKPNFATLPLKISEESATELYQSDQPELVKTTLHEMLGKVFEEGLIADEDLAKLRAESVQKITRLSLDYKAEENLRVANLRLVSEAIPYTQNLIPDKFYRSKSMKRAIEELMTLVIRPNLAASLQETEARKKLAMVSAQPIINTIKKDELIVQRGKIVTHSEMQLIDQIQKKLAEKKALDKLSGTTLLVALTYALIFLYFVAFDRNLLRQPRMIILMHTVLVMSVLICKTIADWPNSSVYLMPTALAPLLLALLMPTHFGILGSFVMAIFAAILTNFQPDIIIATFASGFAGTFSTLRLRKRIEFLRLGLAIGMAYFLVVFAYQIYFEFAALEAAQISALGLANGLLITTPICFFIVPFFFEPLFNLVTDVTLLELSDLNHPLLKRMVVEAPGTYHHSLVVSTLAESACEKIGANALLARVGCYFHDIGKIARAEYFTENQGGHGVNKHLAMSPTMSSLMIMEHVKSGVELGKQHKLKQRILDFIPEHHGTQVIYYFYRKALDNAKPGQRVDPNDFRYSGPKPQSRETAITLLADSTEAASRSLKEPNAENIRQLVRKIINDKFIDGQLDECNLTLRNLHVIQESFVQNLMAIYHTRVAYPTKPDVPDKFDLFKQDKMNVSAPPDPRGKIEY